MKNTIEKNSVREAIARDWSNHDNDIHVDVSGDTVTLSGTVNHWYQKEEAARTAWNTPGIRDVNNELKIDYYCSLNS
jgi:osmotically-inducible protein OsmY